MSPGLPRFAILLGAGFLTAAAIGKLVPHVRWIAETYDVSLGMAGLAVSAVMLPGALLSAAMGVVSDRFGARTVTIAGLMIAAAASMLLGSVSGFWPLVMLRLAEGIGYSLLVVAATVLVIEVSTPHHRTLALAVWSSFAPIGFALGQWAASAAEGPGRLSVIGLWHGVLLAAASVAIMLTIPSRLGRAAVGSTGSVLDAARHPPALLAALAFGCVTGVLLAAVAVTPLVLAQMNGISVAQAARMTALAALPGIVGRFAAGWLLGSRLTPASVIAAAGTAGALMVALVLLARIPLAVALALFTLFQILMGIIPGVLSAMIPQVAPEPGKLGAVSGLVNQMVTLGNLIGPPLVLAIYAAGDAAAGVAMLSAWTLLCVALVARLAVFRREVA